MEQTYLQNTGECSEHLTMEVFLKKEKKKEKGREYGGC